MPRGDERARQERIRTRNTVDRLLWPHEEVLTFLRARSPYLSLHRRGDDPVADAKAKRVLYRWTGG